MGRGEAPKTAEEWRQKFAVLDEFNRNGMVAMIHIPLGGGVKAPACTSTVSEQLRDKIAGQYSEGGGKTVLENGIQLEARHSGWKSINGKVGYGSEVIPGLVERLGVTEMRSKVGQTGVQQGAQQAAWQTGGAVAKDQRAAPNREKK